MNSRCLDGYEQLMCLCRFFFVKEDMTSNLTERSPFIIILTNNNNLNSLLSQEEGFVFYLSIYFKGWLLGSTSRRFCSCWQQIIFTSNTRENSAKRKKIMKSYLSNKRWFVSDQTLRSTLKDLLTSSPLSKCYGDVSYHTPKMYSSNLNLFSELSSLWKDNFSFLTRHLTDGLQAEHG